ncbi:D-xylose-binding periplasmic protein [Geodia barretti]|uniref:D-xylose-binding periplasmic protein n=1 Tax=Geodia barretti TaxID=519541 RepID=A0AA35WA61_GEOBA|nr:D-xylose-binding periplasmic protein [Geodia barretti]
MRLSTYNGNFWLPVGARSPRPLRRRDRQPVPYNGDSCVKTTSLFCVLTACLVILFGCADPGAQKKSEEADATATKKIKIGLSMDSLRVERWQKDRDIFTAEAERLGAEVIVQSADGDERRQNEQAENMITQGVDVLVVIPKDSVAASQIVQAAHAEGIKVIAYDRLIRESSPDLYISFDNEQVGYLQAEYLLRQKPEGAYFLLGGAQLTITHSFSDRDNSVPCNPQLTVVPFVWWQEASIGRLIGIRATHSKRRNRS